MLPFEFVVEGPPVSQQTRRKARRRAWVDELRRRAMSRWTTGEPPVVGPIRVDITYVFVSVTIDLDNLAKPVLDALKGVVFQDDGQISDMRIRKREFGRIMRIETPLPLLLEALDRAEEFLHILVEEAPDQEVVD